MAVERFESFACLSQLQSGERSLLEGSVLKAQSLRENRAEPLTSFGDLILPHVLVQQFD